MLTNKDNECILSEFPNIKLSYENITHKKVYGDIILAIPEGKKCFAWFTTFNDCNVCLLMELSENKQIKDIKITNACFSSELSYGTILYGTLFYHSYNRFFSIEDIFVYKGKTVEKDNWGNKFLLLRDLLKKDMNQISYNNTFIVFGMPLLSNNIDDLMIKIQNVKYKIDTVQFRSFNRSNNYLFMSYTSLINYENKIEPELPRKQLPVPLEKEKEKIFVKNVTRREIKKEIVFLVKPDIQNDIYHLYYNENLQHIYYDIALIPDFITSVMMNKLFRKIKENDNLDALEESDDEEEFENENDDRFVYLDKEYKMVCSYNYKFKKWYPLKLADQKTEITFKKDLPIIEKK